VGLEVKVLLPAHLHLALQHVIAARKRRIHVAALDAVLVVLPQRPQQNNSTHSPVQLPPYPLYVKLL
jgi:hypothetical protein